MTLVAGASTKPGEFIISTSSTEPLLEPILVSALVSWMPPSQKLTGSKMMESPRGLPPALAVLVVMAADDEVTCTGAGGGRGSSAPIPKEKSSNDIPLSLPGALAALSSPRVLFRDVGAVPSLDPTPKSIPAAGIKFLLMRKYGVG